MGVWGRRERHERESDRPLNDRQGLSAKETGQECPSNPPTGMSALRRSRFASMGVRSRFSCCSFCRRLVKVDRDN